MQVYYIYTITISATIRTLIHGILLKLYGRDISLIRSELTEMT